MWARFEAHAFKATGGKSSGSSLEKFGIERT